jgi:hypothetical protein
MRTLGIGLALLAVMAAACDTSTSDDVELGPATGGDQSSTSPETSTATSGNGSPPVPVSTDPVEVSTKVTVDADMRVEQSGATEAFIEFVRAHAEAVNTGYPTDALKAITTPRQLAKQARTITWAGEHGLGVSNHPRVGIVGARDTGTDEAWLDTCLWLPSTEFVDRASGLPVNGSVPAVWKAAGATLTRQNDVWRLDTLVQATEENTTNCGVLT